jgi:uncharacterized cupredoxin-like copper-binding protein
MSVLRPGIRGLAPVFAAGAIAAGCGGGDGTGSASSNVPSDTVGVKATEMKFDLTTDRAPAGKVTFNVENAGAVEHEMVVIRTDTPAGDLPEKNGERDETGAIGALRAKQLQPGASASLTRTMKAGHYALVCALPGHYEAGMYSDFTVG